MNPEGKVRHPFGSRGLKSGKSLTQLLAEARIEALEEAAKECDIRIELLHGQFEVLDITRECDAYRIAAAAIRTLKDK